MRLIESWRAEIDSTGAFKASNSLLEVGSAMAHSLVTVGVAIESGFGVNVESGEPEP